MTRVRAPRRVRRSQVAGERWLTGTDLSEADLFDADLDGVNLAGAKLHRANLTDALGVEQIASAQGDMATRLPEGMPRPEPWCELPE